MIKLESRLTKIAEPQHGQPMLIPPMDNRDIWVLRDDELGGFWGTKFRKYASITKHCKSVGISQVIATGGINSNNLAAAAILCAEAGITLTAFAVRDHDDQIEKLAGNRFLLRLAIPPERLILVNREDKHTITQRMQDFQLELNARGRKSLILEEGGGCLAAVPGCLTLADDIIRPRPEWPDNKLPDHIFMDSGTGLSVASLAAGLFKKNLLCKTRIHIIQMAGFEEQIHHAFSNWVTPASGVNWSDVADRVRVYRPLSPRSYGAVSSTLFEFIRTMARQHGLLLDPVYSGKLFLRAFDLIHGQNCRGRILVIHTGGISGLMGFPQLANEI